MASKFGRAGGVPERRVRPIWDAIDSRQFKSALKQVSSLLTKYPNSPYVLSLKALILERMAKPEEALSVCLNAKELLHSNDSALMDDLTLSTLQIVFQRLDHSDLATSCYEYACGKFPNNIDLMMGLFNCYVRESAFVKQQQIAIKMYKIASEERFLLWAVCSIQLQVLCGNGGEKLLRLAEGLLKKHIAAHSLHEPEALMVYISLLEQQDKYSDALELLSGNLGSLLIVEVDKLRIQGRLLARTGDYKAAADVYEKILESCPDDWECLQRYLGCLLEDKQSLAKEPIEVGIRAIELSKLSPLADEEFDSRILRATTFLRKLQENLGNDIIRCPYLANLEIERRKLLHGKGDQEKLIEDLLQYFHRFGHLACFTSDVEVFVQVISLDRRMEFFEKLMKSGEAILPMPPKVLGQSITLLKVQQLLGNMFSLTVGELEDFVVKLVEMYCKNLPLSKDLDPQESMHGEELLSMACNILTQLFWRTGNLGYMVEAVIVLEFGLSIRRHVWQYKILLLHLYSHLGATSLAYDWYKTLEVKNILMETVSHNILPQMLVSPLWVDLNTLLTDYLKFMEDHFKESADLTFLAYRHRNYSKVIEFVQFKERLQNSSQYLLARIESVILQLKQSAGNIEEEELVLENLKSGLHCVELSDEIQSKALTFNEDLESRPWWTPIPGINYLLGPFEEIPKIPRESLLKQSEANIRALIERKALLPRMIYLSIRGASASLKDSVEANGSLSDPNAISEMKLLLDRYAKIGGCLPSVALKMIGEVCKGSKSTEVFGPDEIDWVNFAVFFNACKLNSNENDFCLQDGQVCEFGSWQDVDKLLERCILTRLRSIGSGASVHGNDFEMLVRLITEPLAWHGLLIQSYVRTLVPSGKKKKKSGFMDRSALTLATAARDSIESLAGTIEEVMRCLRDHIRRLENKDENLEGVLASLRHKGGPGQVCQILETIVSSASSNEQGDRISAALKSWNPVNLSRKIVSAQRTVLSDTLSICESKCKVLNTLKQQILQI